MTFRGNSQKGNSAKSRNPTDIFCLMGNVNVQTAALGRPGKGPIEAFSTGLRNCRQRSPTSLPPRKSLHCFSMTVPAQPNLKLINAPDYREAYANSVQMRVNVWDFFMVFGTLQQQTEAQVEIRNFQGIYLSPQQAKALLGLLQQNVAGYESAFGEIKLDPRMNPAGPVH